MNSITNISNPPGKPNISLKDIANKQPFYQGQYCQVYSVTKNGKQYAVKLTFNNANKVQYAEEKKRIYTQIKTLYSIKHQGVIQLLGHFQQDNRMGLIFPMFGRNIGEFIREMKSEKKKKGSNANKFTLPIFLKIFRNIGSAIHQLYVRGLVHRDITQDNILIDNNFNTKLIDFGFVQTIQHCKGKSGTREYLAPEIVKNQRYNHKVDVWSFGILCYELLYAVFLFRPKGELSQQQFDQEFLKNVNLPIDDFSDEKLLLNEKPKDQMLSYLKSMLTVNPDKRPEIGYLLSKKIFGANNDEADNYNVDQYIRQKTFRKSSPMQVAYQNSTQAIQQLQQQLANLIKQHQEQLSNYKHLVIAQALQSLKLQTKTISYQQWKNQNVI